MPAPEEHKTVQAYILAYAQVIGWRYVPRAEAEARIRVHNLDLSRLEEAGSGKA